MIMKSMLLTKVSAPGRGGGGTLALGRSRGTKVFLGFEICDSSVFLCQKFATVTQ